MTPSVPKPSDAALIRLATIAGYVEVVLIPDKPVVKARVGLQTAKNDRRRAMETLLVLIADPEVRDYLAELERLGLVPPTSA
ncbi:MAG TPA: hypothetical protein VFH00_14270 [Candidatus Nitrosotalea sp.]|nr:hypothetical protein [Candidatus Nitrosotalea sp.]